MSSHARVATTDPAGPGTPTFFPDPAIDRLTNALLKLTGEVWVLTERLTAVEALAARRGAAWQSTTSSRPSSLRRKRMRSCRRPARNS